LRTDNTLAPATAALLARLKASLQRDRISIQQ
jgi:hypothetical protein